MSAGLIGQKINSKSDLPKHMSNQNKKGRCQNTHPMKRIIIFPANKTLRMNPINHYGQVWLYLKHKVIELNSKLQPFTNNYKFSIKYRLTAKKIFKSSQNRTSMILKNTTRSSHPTIASRATIHISFTTLGGGCTQETNRISLLGRAMTRKPYTFENLKLPSIAKA